MTPAIRAQNLGKRYRIGTSRGTASGSLLETLTHAAVRLWRRNGPPFHANGPLDGSARRDADTIWALKDVSFEVQPGEVVGIIGRNGAGKSTLLKILSRITEPTEGVAEINGRVASLLEVGTGFHPDLTGRENIYLNGAILGMSKAEVAKKFEEIVAFAEIERFIDTPVKRYSSGMYTRLAFAVAAHLEPEILLVDEVLAVGDASFQKKCLGKIADVATHGRTVLFVSHNMPAVTRLCQRTILLDQGGVLADGLSYRVVNVYLSAGLGTTAVRQWPDPNTAPGNDIVRLTAVRVRTNNGDVSEAIDIRRPVRLEMQFRVLKPGHLLVPNFHCHNDEGTCVFIAADHDPAWKRRTRPVGSFTSTAWIPGNFLAEGTLIVGAALSTMDPVVVHFFEPDAVAFQVIDSLAGDSARGDYAGHYPGVVRPLLEWTTDYSAEHNGSPHSCSR